MSNLIDSEKTCPSCGSQGDIIGVSLGEDVVNCHNCGLCYLQKTVRPRSANDNHWYQELRDCSQDTVVHIISQMESAYSRQIRILEKLSTRKNIIDIGCGLGIFLITAKSLGWEISGLETSEHAKYFAKRNFGIDFLSSLDELPDNTFDVVRISHVLEHIPEPRVFLGSLYRILKPSGILVVIVPNREPLCAMIVNKWRSLFDSKPKLTGSIYPDMHVLGFSVESLKNLANSTNFVQLRSFTVSMGDPTYYPLFYDGLLNRSKLKDIKIKDFTKYYLPMIIDNIGNPFNRGQWIVGYFRK
jgi:SAM-dependent methyltransferase